MVVWYVIGYVVMGFVSIKFGIACVKRTYSEAARATLRVDQGERAAFIMCNFVFWWLTIPGHIIYNHAANLGKSLK